MELQQLGILDQLGAADGAGVQYQRPHPVHQSLVAAHGRHRRPARRHLLRSLRARRARGAAGPLPLALDRRSRVTTADPLVPILWANYTRGDQGRSETIEVSPELDLKVSSRFTTSLGASIQSQPERHPVLRHVHGCVGRRALHLRPSRPADVQPDLAAGLHLHADHVTPDLRVAVRLQGDLLRRARGGGGARERVRRALPPYGDPAVTGDPGGFNFQQFRSNVVFRWEYRPGSTLFLVWSQGREGSRRRRGRQDVPGRSGRPVRPAGGRTFLVKVSYWLTP